MSSSGLLRGTLTALLLLATVRCGSDSGGSKSSDAGPDSGESGGSTGAGGHSSKGGSTSHADSGPSQGDAGPNGTGGSTGSGGKTGGDGGSSSGGHAGSGATGGTAQGGTNAGGAGGSTGRGGSVNQGGAANAGDWTDVSPPSTKGKCGAVVANRLTGDVLVQVRDMGVWKSTDKAGTWSRVDGMKVSGASVMGPALDMYQDDPTRVAAWSLDGEAAWTTGSTWNQMMVIQRNWDFGSTDWAASDPKTMIGALHESSGAVYVSTDAGASWNKLSITVLASGAGFPPPAFAMVGVMDSKTLIYGNGDGIYRSTDTGANFNKVSDLNAQTRVPVLFKGVHYLGGDKGLVVSSDKGATWKAQGAELQMWVGPFFGADEKSMVIANDDGVYKTTDAGANWTKVAALPADTQYGPRVFGGYAWDAKNDILYAGALDKSVLKLAL